MLLSNVDKKILEEAKSKIDENLVFGSTPEAEYKFAQSCGFSGTFKVFKTWLKRNKLKRNDSFDADVIFKPKKINEGLDIFGDLGEKVKKAFEEGATFNEALAYAQSLGFIGKRSAFTTFVENNGIYKRKEYRNVQSELATRDGIIQKMIDAGKSVKEIRRELEDKHGFHCTRDSLSRYLANRHKAVTISGFLTVMKDRIMNRIKFAWRKWRRAWMKSPMKRQKDFCKS